jgi:predicted DNA-binding ribbon-helix-helix protein
MGAPGGHDRSTLKGRGLKKRSVTIAGHATSLSLEEPFWAALRTLAERRRLSLNALVARIDAARPGNLSSALRVFVLECCRRGELAGDDSDATPASVAGMTNSDEAASPISPK